MSTSVCIFLIGVTGLIFTANSGLAVPHTKDQQITLKEYVGRQWSNELIHYDLQLAQGDFPGRTLRVLNADGSEQPSQLSDAATYEDGSLKSATLWMVVTLDPHQTITWTLVPGEPTTVSDLKVIHTDNTLEVTTSLTGARFHLGSARFDTPIPAEQIPAYVTSVRLRSGTWAGRGWFETPHRLRAYKVWVVEEGPIFVKVAFEYHFDGYRGQGADVYKGHVRIAAQQELIEFVEEYGLGDPGIYTVWQPESRAEEIMWDWWQWRPHDAESNFCFSIYDGLKPTKARWYGHNASIPEKRTGRNPELDFETDYMLDTSADRFDIMVNSYHRNCPDQALSYMAWRDGDPDSDVLGVIGLRPTEWLHADMLPHLMSTIRHHTDTACLRIHALARKDLVVKAPLHLGRRVWGLVTLKMPEAGPTGEPKIEGDRTVYPFMTESSQALKLRSKYGNRPLDKIKDWTLEWNSTKTYPSLFVKEGGLEAVLNRIRSSQALMEHARSTQHLPIMRTIVHGGQENATAAYEDLIQWCERHIDILFDQGYCSHRGTNNNQYPWWIQEMSARFDLVMGMSEIPAKDKGRLKAYFSFCVHMLQDDDFMPPRRTGVGWGSANMPRFARPLAA